MPLSIIITKAGRAALINAANDGTAPVRIATVGMSSTATSPTAGTAALAGEFKRIATISGDIVAADTIHLTVRDESPDQYTTRSFALYLEDGTLFASYGQADPIIEKAAQSMLLLAIDIRFVDVSAADLSFGDANFLNPPATTERQGVVELATEAESIAGTDPARIAPVRAMRGAVTAWLDARLGAGAPTAFVKALLLKATAAAFRLELGLKSAALRDEGHGNGLEADLLDGRHGAEFALLSGAEFQGRVKTSGFKVRGLAFDNTPEDSLELSWFNGAGLIYAQRRTVGAMAPVGIGGATIDFYSGADPVGTKVATISPVGLDIFGGLAVNGAIWRGLATVWDAANDGAGSGLDADLLDGQHGSYYLPAASYTALDVRAKLLTVDGHTSELDADLLDGQHGAYYLPAAAYTAADVVAKLRTVDGAGSGLDADLLDGRQSAEFALLSGADFQGRVKTTGFKVRGLAFDNTPEDSLELSWHNGTGLIYAQRRTQAQMAPLGIGGSTIDFYSGADPVGVKVATLSTAGLDILGGLAVTGLMWRANSTVWDAANDGAGSGLDADLLDGQHGSYYLPAAAYTAADVVAKLRTVDGAGSGLDADLLDGRQSAEFALLSGADFQGRVKTTGFKVRGLAFDNTPEDSLELSWFNGAGLIYAQRRSEGSMASLKLGGATVEFQVGTDPVGTSVATLSTAGLDIFGGLAVAGTMWRGGATVWDAANDGSGSGLDADLLDGQHGSFYRDWNNLTNRPAAFPPEAHTHDIAGAFAASFNVNGYVKLPNGIMIQWGRFHVSANSHANVFFPLPFLNACFSVAMSGGSSGGFDSKDNPPVLVTASITVDSFSVFNADDSPCGCAFIAVGY